MFVSNASSSGISPISNSLRLRSAASAYLSRTFGAPTDNKKWTWRGMVKRGAISSANTFVLFNAGNIGTNEVVLGFYNDTLYCYQVSSSTVTLNKISSTVYRDPSAWYDVVFVYDSANATAEDRFKAYINGVRVTAWGTNTNLPLNQASLANSAIRNSIGIAEYTSRYPFDGYLSRVCFVDGQALDPSYFGYTDTATGQWVSRTPSAINSLVGSWGKNGDLWDFDNGTSLTTLGYGKYNSVNWTLNNISITAGVTYDWMTDTPTNNYAVLNPLDKVTTSVLAGANLETTSVAAQASIGSIGVDSGKWYWEFKYSAATASQSVGVYKTSATTATITATTNVIGVRFDVGAGTLDYTVDGTNYTSISTGLTSGPYFPYASSATNAKNIYFNAGQRPFTYTPPTGYKALCTANLTSDTVTTSGTFTGNANADGPFVWCNGTPETLTINSNAVTFGTHADKLANGFKLRTASASYNTAGSNTWTATVLSPSSKSAFRNQRAKGNP